MGSNPDAGARQIYARRRPVSDPDARRYLLPAAEGIRIFRIEVMVIAVPAAMSNQGILSRYHEQVLDRGHGRLTVQATPTGPTPGSWILPTPSTTTGSPTRPACSAAAKRFLATATR